MGSTFAVLGRWCRVYFGVLPLPGPGFCDFVLLKLGAVLFPTLLLHLLAHNLSAPQTDKQLLALMSLETLRKAALPLLHAGTEDNSSVLVIILLCSLLLVGQALPTKLVMSEM